jgi:hypothetical protein
MLRNSEKTLDQMNADGADLEREEDEGSEFKPV